MPILISVPHGGWKVPDELKDRVCLSRKDLFDDSDPYTVEIYDVREQVEKFISTDIARAFVDVNRSVDDRPPKNPDGVIKSTTCYEKTIYKPGLEPDDSLINDLLKKYYYTYHEKIKKTLQDSDIRLALDCHSMASKAPDIAPDCGKKRPMICLGNNYGKSCSNVLAEELAECFREIFELKRGDVVLNSPFSGGYITKNYESALVPWIQVEIDRSLYLTKPWFDPETLHMDPKRICELNRKFSEVLNSLYKLAVDF